MLPWLRMRTGREQAGVEVDRIMACEAVPRCSCSNGIVGLRHTQSNTAGACHIGPKALYSEGALQVAGQHTVSMRVAVCSILLPTSRPTGAPLPCAAFQNMCAPSGVRGTAPRREGPRGFPRPGEMRLKELR